MSTVATLAPLKQPKIKQSKDHFVTQKVSTQSILPAENPSQWPRDILEAYARWHGPYTLENAETILENEAVELYNGWLVWQDMTNLYERRAVANIQSMLDISARKANYGQTLSDQMECMMSDGATVKPDSSLISWQRLEEKAIAYGPRQRPTLIGGPELAIEVRSPGNRRAQEKRKRTLYFANGVQIVWDVDEENQVIWVYHAETPTQPIRFDANDEINCEPLLPGWRRKVADMFAKQVSAETVIGEVAVAIFNDGKSEGFSQGKSEGVNEGAAQTLRQLLPMLARMRFTADLPGDLSQRLAQCNLEHLQVLQNQIEKSSDLTSWLRLLSDQADPM